VRNQNRARWRLGITCDAQTFNARAAEEKAINETVDKIVLNPFRVGTGGCAFSPGCYPGLELFNAFGVHPSFHTASLPLTLSDVIEWPALARDKAHTRF
jgi:hypothetical protein